ncbi:hypothetical protein K7X08_018637 [Anisodus acutangulus]|uniref:Uncharacterized protein n=1 Tax=Anisodus acutangulus TaxID=402998 RepID=A0A9Q1LXB9_9SOLA|nr:hypothetical protein K7X08_018637 [Anisodus acutangulus]
MKYASIAFLHLEDFVFVLISVEFTENKPCGSERQKFQALNTSVCSTKSKDEEMNREKVVSICCWRLNKIADCLYHDGQSGCSNARIMKEYEMLIVAPVN